MTTNNPAFSPATDLDSLTVDDLRLEIARLSSLLARVSDAPPVKAPAKRASKALGLPGLGTEADPRMLSNVQPCRAPSFKGDPNKLTPAQSQRARTEAHLACGCRLCALALHPAQTFEEAGRVGLVYLGIEGVRQSQGA